MKITTNRDKILDTLEYFLQKYLQAADGHKDSSGLEGMVMENFIAQLRWLRADHKRLKELHKPKIIDNEVESGKEHD